MAKPRATSLKMAKLAGKVLHGYEPTRDEIESLAACVLAQREREEAAKVIAVETAAEAPAETEASEVPAPVETPEQITEPKGFWSNLFRR